MVVKWRLDALIDACMYAMQKTFLCTIFRVFHGSVWYHSFLAFAGHILQLNWNELTYATSESLLQHFFRVWTHDLDLGHADASVVALAAPHAAMLAVATQKPSEVLLVAFLEDEEIRIVQMQDRDPIPALKNPVNLVSSLWGWLKKY
jgi:hypothetical protein